MASETTETRTERCDHCRWPLACRFRAEVEPGYCLLLKRRRLIAEVADALLARREP